jgi:hypothetical protein
MATEIETAPTRKASPGRWIVVGGAAFGVLAITAAAVVFTRSRADTAEPAFIVVDRRGSDVSERGSATIVVDAAVAVSPAIVDAAPRAPVQPPTDTDTAQLTRAFERQTGAITVCFRQHPDGVGGEPIWLRLQIDVRGKVVGAEVLPADLAATELGKCLEQVARAAQFGPQPKPATFRLPIHTAARGSAAR